jgi:hypothetical protein
MDARATKARLVRARANRSIAGADAWFAGDAPPITTRAGLPPTVPLLQGMDVFVLGRWTTR